MTWINPQKWATETAAEQKEEARLKSLSSGYIKEQMKKGVRAYIELSKPGAFKITPIEWPPEMMRTYFRRKCDVLPIYTAHCMYTAALWPGSGVMQLRQEATCPKKKTMTQLILEFGQVYISAGYHDVK